jgi:cytoskeleton-associated protein 5
LNSLILCFSSADIFSALSQEILSISIKEILDRLLDSTLSNLEQGPALSKMLNLLMIRALQNPNCNTVFAILLNLLGNSSDLLAKMEGKELASQSKTTELIMKCIWKLIKTIPQLIEEKSLNVDSLLLEVHEFLKNHPPTEWKRRITANVPQADMPLRTVKTILSMILNSLGQNVFSHMVLISNAESSHVFAYLKQMIESGEKKKNKENEYGLPSSNAVKMSFDELKAVLDSIFAKISRKEETKIGIQELYQFKKMHPYATDIVEERLSNSGGYIQGYIKRGLIQLEEAEKMPAQEKSVNVIQMNVPVASKSSEEDKKETANDKSMNVDRSMAVAELKERLQRMKMTMQK